MAEKADYLDSHPTFSVMDGHPSLAYRLKISDRLLCEPEKIEGLSCLILAKFNNFVCPPECLTKFSMKEEFCSTVLTCFGKVRSHFLLCLACLIWTTYSQQLRQGQFTDHVTSCCQQRFLNVHHLFMEYIGAVRSRCVSLA